MASKKQLKKDINNSVGALIEEIYVWELLNPKGDFKKSEKLIDEAADEIESFVEKANLVNPVQ